MVWRLTIIHYYARYTTAYTKWERGSAHIRWNIGYKVIRNIVSLLYSHVVEVCHIGQLFTTCNRIPQHSATHTLTYKIFFTSTKPAFYYHFLMMVYWFWSIIMLQFRNFWVVIDFLNVKFKVVPVHTMKAYRVNRGIISTCSWIWCLMYRRNVMSFTSL
jgi:hypothetical protein